MSNTIITDLSDFILNKRQESYKKRFISRDNSILRIKEECNDQFINTLDKIVRANSSKDSFLVPLYYKVEEYGELVRSPIEIINILKDNIQPLEGFKIDNFSYSPFTGETSANRLLINVCVTIDGELLKELKKFTIVNRFNKNSVTYIR